MTIQKSVGKNCTNEKADAKLVQAALNLIETDKFSLEKKLTVDGGFGKGSIAALESFQSSVMEQKKPDGVVSPGGQTIEMMRRMVPKGLSEDAFIAIMAYGTRSRLKLYHPLFVALMPNYQVNTPLRVAHFLAQVGHESLSLALTEELASGADYENREDLGNTQPGDGKRFKGRGFLQVTGRANYDAYAGSACLNLMQKGNEVLIAKVPRHALDASLWFWEQKKLNQRAD